LALLDQGVCIVFRADIAASDRLRGTLEAQVDVIVLDDIALL
jgi:hypothetical protein